MSDVDTIIIGSGAGGLTAAVALARAGERVLVLEQHELPGGWCHSFRLGGHQFSPGVHYLGEMGEGGRFRRLLEGLGVAESLVLLELNPDGYEHVRIGDIRFDIPRGKEHFADRLKSRFPKEAVGIDRYFDTVQRLASELDGAVRKKGFLAPLTLPLRAPTLTRWGLTSARHLIESHLSDPVLRAILSVQAGDHGLGPGDVPGVVHAAVQSHYFEGGWYPMGGGASIPRAFLKVLRRHGGSLRVRTPVERILTEAGSDGRRRAIGVRLADGEEIRAKRVISNADPGVTFGRLLPREDVPPALQKKLAKTRWSTGCLSLFLAVDHDLVALGMDSGNYWYNQDPDVHGTYQLAKGTSLDGEDLPGQFVTVTTLKDRSKLHGTSHTIESFVFVNYDMFARWAHTRYGDRPEDYETLKRDLTRRMLRGVERYAPGVTDRVTFSALGTPLTNEHYVASTRGNLYGTDKILRQVGPFAWKVRTPIENLYCCGASTLSHGVMGAAQSGLAAAASALGTRGSDLLNATNQRLTLLPADQPDAWPVDIQKRVARRRSMAEQKGGRASQA